MEVGAPSRKSVFDSLGRGEVASEQGFSPATHSTSLKLGISEDPN